MFEEYLKDTKHFYQQAILQTKAELARANFRASVFCASSAMEAFINFVGETVETSEILNANEIAYLNDKILEVNPSKGNVEERKKFQPIDGKIKFLIKKFSVDIEIQNDLNWSKFISLKQLRDKLVHSKEFTDNTPIDNYKKKLTSGINSTIYLIDRISRKIFSKGLRRQILDMRID